MIAAIVVLYYPDMCQVERLLMRAKEQAEHLILVDNSATKNDFSSLVESHVYLHFPQNIGIAAAHNAGLQQAQLLRCRYAVLLDQDSMIPDDMFFSLSSLLLASEKLSHNIAAIGPKIRCVFSEKHVNSLVQRRIFEYEDVVGVTQIIASGMMIDLNCLDEIGYKDERLFIDGVDHEWCWRARINGYYVALAKQVEMYHRLGDSREKFLGITYKVGSPIRLYYQFRNILLLSRRAYVPTYWKLRNLTLMPGRMFINVCLESKRRERLKYICLGLYHGLIGRKGKLY
jgi:rhamnosyltransferase